jgi:hypothetical protein
VLSKLAWLALAVAACFNALSAVGGGVAILVTDGLVGSPFASFFFPAVVLLAVVGGTQVAAAALLLLRRPSALFWAAFAGFTMVTWILIETAIIRGFGILQALYYLTGVAELVLVLALLGIVSWMPPLGRAASPERANAGHSEALERRARSASRDLRLCRQRPPSGELTGAA